MVGCLSQTILRALFLHALPGAQVACVQEEEEISKKLNLSMQYNLHCFINEYSLKLTGHETFQHNYIVGYTLHLLIILQYEVMALWMYAVLSTIQSIAMLM